MRYRIGGIYRYPVGKKIFKLVEVDGYRFKFECGHWCTEFVFEDLLECNPIISNQLTLF